VLVYGWIATMYKGRIRFTTPMLWFLGFIATFSIGGLAGVMLAVPPADFQLHNSLFLVAHFHTMVIGGVLFGIFCGINYWFPKMAGFRLNERIGRYSFWCWIVGFLVAFVPMYVLGIMGATRRLDHYDASTGWQPFYIMMLIGGLIIMAGVVLQLVQIFASLMQKRRLVDTTGDPWDGRTMEWATLSPPPFYNFAVIPQVTSRDEYFEVKKRGGLPKPIYEDIHMPKNTAAGIYIAAFAFAASFAFVWHITWLAIVGIIGVIVCFIARTFNEDIEYVLTAAEVEKFEEDRKKKLLTRTTEGEDMGLWEFVKVVVTWAWDVVRNQGWRKW
jgi:cytochrome o ubiquinol oxidase subunit 1